MRLKKVLIFIAGALIAALVYIVLSESFTPASFIIGAILGISSMFVCILFFPNEFLLRYDIKILPLVWYLIRLIFIIIISGIKSLILGFSEKSSSLLITYKSSLIDDTLITLLANSITLTPGTTTIDKNGATLKVMKLCKSRDENDVSDIAHLEAMIKKVQRNNV